LLHRAITGGPTIREAIVSLLAVIGALCLLSIISLLGLHRLLYATEVIRTLPSPDHRASAQIEVTKGGFGTVWTTEVYLRSRGNNWIIYKSRDSDFEPPLRWRNGETLVVGLPCDRFDHTSNPDDWERDDPGEHRLRMIFEYPADCRPPKRLM
jgi:hypothetical protein